MAVHSSQKFPIDPVILGAGLGAAGITPELRAEFFLLIVRITILKAILDSWRVVAESRKILEKRKEEIRQIHDRRSQDLEAQEKQESCRLGNPDFSQRV